MGDSAYVGRAGESIKELCMIAAECRADHTREAGVAAACHRFDAKPLEK
jgi:hypothetical protein